MTIKNTIKEFPSAVLKGSGQVMFQNNVWAGLFFLLGIFWGAYEGGRGIIAWGALTGLVVATITGYLLPLSREEGRDGLWGFNAILLGGALPTFLGNTWQMWVALIIGAAMTVWMRTAINNVVGQWKINSLTWPFVITTWIFVLASRMMSGMPSEFLSVPALSIYHNTDIDLNFILVIKYWLKGISQVFLINSWITGIFFLVALLISNRWAALWAAIGSALALVVELFYLAPGADIANGLYGFSPVLTAIALGCTFLKPNWKTALWTLLGIIVTVFIQAGMNAFMLPFGIPALTAPFCIATWLFLLPQFKFNTK